MICATLQTARLVWREGRIGAMPDIKLYVRNTEDGKEHVISCPPDLKVADFIAELLDGLQLPVAVWVLDDEESGFRLDPKATLISNGVANGHHLRLHRDVQVGEKAPHKKLLGEEPPMEVEELEEEEDLQKAPCKPPRKPLLQDEVRLWFSVRKRGRHATPATPSSVLFTTFHPKQIRPTTAYRLLAYAHVSDALAAVKADAEGRLGHQFQRYSQRAAEPTHTVSRGARITVIPYLSGCRFNRPSISFDWIENWHCAEFQFEADPSPSDSTVTGAVGFYVGPILVAEVLFSAVITASSPEATALPQSSTVRPYSAVFVSYSHADRKIVDSLERAYAVLGLRYLRDVRELRSGENWNAALKEKIEIADIFQLCWSNAAKSSPNVEEEWRHAIRQERPQFIRPVYWERPMPTPPLELENIHFAYLELQGRRGIFSRIHKWFRRLVRNNSDRYN